MSKGVTANRPCVKQSRPGFATALMGLAMTEKGMTIQYLES